jgi:flagellar P-ring protein precursor FlgI
MAVTRLARTLGFMLVALGVAQPALGQQSARVRDLTYHAGDVPLRLVGYGLVVGLDGTGDRTLGTTSGSTMTVRSVINLLRRFNIEVPPERMRLRNVAVVLVTAEVSPWLRSGGRFEVQVSALGDATSLRGGVLWVTPLVLDPNQPPLATAQGPLEASDLVDRGRRTYNTGSNAGRIPAGGILEVDPQGVAAPAQLKLMLKQPDLGTATRIADAIGAAYGDSAARVLDPGAIELTPGGTLASNPVRFISAVDTLSVTFVSISRIVIDSRAGTVVAGGDIQVGPAVVSHQGITLRVGGATPPAPAGPDSTGTMVQVGGGSSIQDIAAGLHAVGAKAEEIDAIFDALQRAGVLRAEVVIR